MRHDSKHWPTLMIDCVLSGVSDPLATRHLDDLLQWLSGTDSRGTRRLQKAFVLKPVAIERAKMLSTEFIDSAYISYHRNPWHMFGLAQVAHRVTDEEIRLRYRRLIRIFHPDRGSGDSAWLASRSEKINKAYKEITEENVSPTDTYNNITGTFVNLDQFNSDYTEASLREKIAQRMSDVLSRHRDKGLSRDTTTA